MVLGIVAVTLAWIPLIGIVSIPLVLVGMPLSVIGLRQSRESGSGVGIAAAGLATNSVGSALYRLLFVPLRNRHNHRPNTHSLAAMVRNIERANVRRNSRFEMKPQCRRGGGRRDAAIRGLQP